MTELNLSELNLSYAPDRAAYCPTSRSGLHSMYGYEHAHHDINGNIRPTVCIECGQLCVFNWNAVWWEATEPYVICEEPA
ncbi:MAG TPA: hypothetical protein VFH56_02875 [Acidimicrobiales bacterium]|nr:hypothetical protein [Acidimicrobiales bacterium]